MNVTQIAIFLENKTGRLAEVGRILAEARINIRALSLADTSDFGVLRMLVDDPAKAKETLVLNGFTVRQTEVVGVQVKDRPGGLLEILDILSEARVNIEYMYAYANPKGDKAILIFRFDRMDEAVSRLAEKGVRVLDAEALAAISDEA